MNRGSNTRKLLNRYRKVEQDLYDELRKNLLGIAADEIVFGGDFEACALQIEDMIGRYILKLLQVIAESGEGNLRTLISTLKREAHQGGKEGMAAAVNEV